MGEKSYYADFVNKLRENMDTSTDKKYLLSASPKCLYPNRILEEAYEKHSDKFDYLFLDTDETTCNLKNENEFTSSLNKWLALPGPEIFFTIPAGERVAFAKSNYLTRTEVNAMIQVRHLLSVLPISKVLLGRLSLVQRQQCKV